jgi:hypothetical protein
MQHQACHESRNCVASSGERAHSPNLPQKLRAVKRCDRVVVKVQVTARQHQVCQRTRQARMQRVLTKGGAGRAVQDTQEACGNALGQQ